MYCGLREHQPCNDDANARRICRDRTAGRFGWIPCNQGGAVGWFPCRRLAAAQIDRAIAEGVDAVVAMREAVGARVALMVDCHSFFSVEQAVRIAQRLEPQQLTVVRGTGGARER
jgi:L-alanine-DL-glutamate epimerase-like enolase superfamily enzyme